MANPNTFPVEQEVEALHQAEQMGPAPDHAPPLPESITREPIAVEVDEVEQSAEEIKVRRLSPRSLKTLSSKVKEFVSIPDEAGVIGAYDANRAGAMTNNPNARALDQQRARNRRAAQGPDFSGQRRRGDH